MAGIERAISAKRGAHDTWQASSAQSAPSAARMTHGRHQARNQRRADVLSHAGSAGTYPALLDRAPYCLEIAPMQTGASLRHLALSAALALARKPHQRAGLVGKHQRYRNAVLVLSARDRQLIIKLGGLLVLYAQA